MAQSSEAAHKNKLLLRREEKTEYCNVPEPARRSLVQRKQTNSGDGFRCSNSACCLKRTPAPAQPTYAAGAAAIVGSEGPEGGGAQSTSGGVNYCMELEWRAGAVNQRRDTHHKAQSLLLV
jgi:hypothetical protein